MCMASAFITLNAFAQKDTDTYLCTYLHVSSEKR